MRKILGVILLCASLIGHAQEMKSEIVISPKSCEIEKFLRVVKAEYRSQMFEAAINGVKYCAIINPNNGDVVVIDENGSIAEIAPTQFK